MYPNIKKEKEVSMNNNIILSGVGGQGILTIAAAIGMASLREDLFLKQAEVHGMSQRGGAVQSHLRISKEKIYSDLISAGQADLILSVEPMEALRYIPYLKKEGFLVTNSNPFINIPNYPEKEKLWAEIKKTKNSVIVDADNIARECGNIKASNIVMLGAASVFLDLKTESLIHGIESIFSGKGSEIVELNIEAFKKGRTFAKESR
jgi:indolepyruvate ferredoxin oxidoreductase beta subunit